MRARSSNRQAPGGLAVAALLALFSVLAACDDGGDEAGAASSTTSVPPVVAGPVAATELLTGDCLAGIVIGIAERVTVDSLRVVSCDGPHELEVFSVFTLDSADFAAESGDYPGRERVVEAADQGCTARFEELGDDIESLGLLAVWPTKSSWTGGDRTVACAAYDAAGEPFETRRLIAG